MTEKDFLAHHGILGQKWGKQNGPPYPLKASDKSAAERKASGRQGYTPDEKYAKKLKKRSKEVWQKNNYDPKKRLEKEELLKSKDAMQLWLQRDDLSQKEMEERIKRLNTEQQLKEWMEKQNKASKSTKAMDALIKFIEKDIQNGMNGKKSFTATLAWGALSGTLLDEYIKATNEKDAGKQGRIEQWLDTIARGANVDLQMALEQRLKNK